MSSSGSHHSQRVGPYRLLRPLGRGGQATVWEAVSDLDGRRVAIKRLHARALLLHPEASARLRREMELLRGWSHPGVVHLLDAGEADGIPYLVYELVPGAVPVDEASRGLPLRGRVRLIVEAAHALGAVHARGVVHRDVTPSNLLVDAHGRVRLVDFGLARGPDDPQLTRTGAALGTPGWLAPEVAMDGSRAAAGVAADVWSLGATLYAVLTGEPPFAGLGLVELVQRLEREGPPSPRARAPEVTLELDQVCRRAMALHPAERFPDAGSFAQALAHAMASLPTTSPSGTGSTRLAPGWRGPLAGDPVPGERWGRWAIVRPLGEGGMGRVYLARDEEGGGEVALKVLPASAGERQQRRFLREAQAGVRVRHPGLIRVLDAGEFRGRAWLAMEVAQGQGLNLVFEEGPLAPDEAVRLCALLAHALQALHEVGIVHRDVKPENVVLGPDGAPRILDLGVALLEDSERLTRTHATVGTPLYMAPEQLSGGDVDLRADVWSLGAVLYEALTGAPPGGRSISAIELAASRAQLPPPPSRLRPGIDPRLDAICLRCLEPEPRRRWSSADELARALDGWTPGGLPGRSWRGLLLASSGAAALIAGAALWLTSSTQATWRAGSLGRELESRAQAAPRLAEVTLDPDLLRALERADPDAEVVQRALAWVGLVRLAQGDRTGAAAALERAGPASGPAGLALRGGVQALASQAGRGDYAAAVEALDEAERAGLQAPELLGWRVRALAGRGLSSREEAQAGLELLERAERAGAGSPDDRRCLEAACRVALGEESAAQAALAGVDDLPERLAWEVGLLGCQQALRTVGRVRSARDAVRGLRRPAGPLSPREEEVLAHATELARGAARAALPDLPRLRELADLLELLPILSGGAPAPDSLRDVVLGLLRAGPLADGQPEAARLAAAAAEAWPKELEVLTAAAERAGAQGAAPADFGRLALVARRLAGEGPPGQRDSARAWLALCLARAGRAAAARAEAAPLLAAADELAPATRGLALLAAATAERLAGNTDAALAHLARAGSETPGVAAERLQALIDGGRTADAAREAAALVTHPLQLGPRLEAGAELAWGLLEGNGAARLRLAQELVNAERDPLGLWSLRLACLRARNGDAAGARQALEAARERRFTRALDLPALLTALAKGDPMALEVITQAEQSAGAWSRARWQERRG